MKLERLLFKNITPDEELLDIATAKIFYVFSGRNAWHSTWINQYSDGCMHTTLDSAKKFAEKGRTSGTVFNIKELPCLLLKSSSTSVIITQIGAARPLSQYSSRATTKTISAATIYDHEENYIHQGSSFRGTILSFRENSRFWRSEPPKKSIIVLEHNDESELSLIGRKPLLLYTSSSMGSDYYLKWTATPTTIDSNTIKNISKSFKSRSKDTNNKDHKKLQVVQTMNTTDRLKSLSIKHKDNLDEKDLTFLIDDFYDDLLELFTEKMIGKISDNKLRSIFVHWTHARHSSALEDRLNWLAGMLHIIEHKYEPSA